MKLLGPTSPSRGPLLPQHEALTCSPRIASPHTSPHCCDSTTTSLLAGAVRGHGRGDLEGAKRTPQLYFLPRGLPFGDPSTARGGCCEKWPLPRAWCRNQQGSHRWAPCWDRQERVSSLGSLFNLERTYFLNRKLPSSYHHYNVYL